MVLAIKWAKFLENIFHSGNLKFYKRVIVANCNSCSFVLLNYFLFKCLIQLGSQV